MTFMRGKRALKRTMGRLCCSAVLVLGCLVTTAPAGQDQDNHASRLLHAGLDLFPSFLAADQQISAKQDKDGKLLIYIVHHNDRRTAQHVASQLLDIETIKNLPLRVVVIRDDDDAFHQEQPAGIFIAQPHLPHLASVVTYGISKSILTFSPFAGDVSKGVAGSIAVTARILPQVNTTTLADSRLVLKPFFLRIASHYPEVDSQ